MASAVAALPVSFSWYQDVYGGFAEAEAFSEALPAAVRLVRQITRFARVGAHWREADADAWRRAVCAAAEAVAEFGEGRVGGVEIGDFKVTNYMEKGTTGREVALEAAMAELSGAGLAFSGVA